MHFFYFNSRIGRYIFFIAAILLVGGSLWVSNNLVKKLELEERNKMEIWAAATSELASGDDYSNIDLILTIIQSNTTIPVIVTDHNEIIQYSNITINSADTSHYLTRKLESMQRNGSTIDIDLGNGEKQTLYYEDSVLLKQLSYYPYIQHDIQEGGIQYDIPMVRDKRTLRLSHPESTHIKEFNEHTHHPHQAHSQQCGEDQIPFTDIHQIRRKVRQRLKHDYANQAKQDGESHLLQVHERGITYNPRIGMEQAKAYQIRNQAYQQRDQ